ncbi:MAG TPA: aminotransferase class I/II-fold pyridoxal phosphate-dependent enzyme [Vicinamibacterales bacterium]|nr:aminotransferase class I/II-fold pyridoxal phosphate-dependent enzyme [Vicinamibacterales bacterium]
MTQMVKTPASASGDIQVAHRVNTFSYAIRNIVVEAQRVEAAGMRVRYLNVGDPNVFGFKTPPHLIAAVERAMRDGHNGYGPSPGIPAAREAVAKELTSHGFPVSADRALITAGTSEAIDLVLSAVVDSGGEVLVPMPTYPLYTAVLAKIDARAKFYRTDPSRGWQPDLDHIRSLITPATRAMVVIDPNNPTGATYPASTRRELIELCERHNLLLLADEVYGDLGYDGPVDPIGKLNPDAAIITFSSLSKAYLAPGWRTGWLGVGRTPRLDSVLAAIKKLADGRLCSTYPMQFAVAEALLGDRSHQPIFRAELKKRADITAKSLNAIPGMTCVAPIAGFYVMPQLKLPAGKTDVDYVLGLLRATGVLCVYGSGFGMPAEGGFFRVVFLASPEELTEIYSLMAGFTKEFLGV